MNKDMDIDKIIAWKANEISNWIAKEYDMGHDGALALFKQSRVYKLMYNPKTDYVYEGNVSLYYEFRREYDDLYMTGEPALDENTPHRGLLEWMKAVYTKAKGDDFEWKPLFHNNMPSNGLEGIYTDMFFNRDDHFNYVKLTIEYQPRCDEDGFTHPEEGIKYYVLHLLEEDDLNETFEIPEPSDDCFDRSTKADKVNDYGRFRYVFDDQETAKKVACNELLQMIYPAMYILTYEEERYLKWFVKNFEKQ